MSEYFKILIIVYFSLSLPIYAQESLHINPVWSVGYGNKEHASRDDLLVMKYDTDSNLVVLGSVERDSSFSDIMVQKYSQQGSLIWQKNYSSGKEMDYDVPWNLIIDSKSNIIILGHYTTVDFAEIKPDGRPPEILALSSNSKGSVFNRNHDQNWKYKFRIWEISGSLQNYNELNLTEEQQKTVACFTCSDWQIRIVS